MTEPEASSLPRPESAHINDSARGIETSNEPEHDPDIEATELRPWSRAESITPPGEAGNLQESTAANGRNPRPLRRIGTSASHKNDNAIRKFWRRQIRVAVPHEDCRDHLALERTYLGYLRTSVSLSMLGVVIAQLFRLDHNPSMGDGIGFYELGRPLSTLFISAAIAVMLLGGWRFWRLQNAMIRRKVIAAGWELHVLTFIVASLMIVVFAGVIRVNPQASNHNGDNGNSSVVYHSEV